MQTHLKPARLAAASDMSSLDNTLEISDFPFSGNQSTGSAAAIVVYTDEGDAGGPGGGGAPVNFILNNTIIANKELMNVSSPAA